MSYFLDVSSATAKVLEEPAVRHVVDDERNSLDDAYIRAQLASRVEAIRSQISTSEYDALETERIETERSFKKALNGNWIERSFASLLFTFLALMAITIFLLLFSRSLGLDSTIAKILPSSYQFFAEVALVGSFGAFLVVNASWRLFLKPRLRRQLAVAYDFEGLERRKELMAATLDKALEKTVREEILQVINSVNKNFYQSKLRMPGSGSGGELETSADGLSETTSPSVQIPTAARRAIIKQLETLPGASIGVSGPRGVGKTTLLLSICKGNPRLRGREAIGIYTSAPVEYDGREFLLHLFTSLCRQVLKTAGVDEDRSLWAIGDDDDIRESKSLVFRRDLVIRVVLGYVGLALTALGIFLAASKVNTITNKEGFVREGFGQLLKLWSEALGLQPGLALFSGMLVVLVGALAPSPRRFRRRYRLMKDDPLATNAQYILRDLKFQRNFTSGWSGALKIPAGLELGTTKSLGLAFRPESLPELVLRFRTFVQEITSKYVSVVIAIDELDKLKSAEAAETFLNELKSIFNIPNCFYLVSISESALSAFQRRGLPFRDAFDSAFDDILYVDYLTFSGSRALLARRVLNLPGPFVSVAHVLSGGLPRELIRVTRSILDVASRRGPITIQEVVCDIVNDELRNKCRAVGIVVRQFPTTTAAAFLLDISELENGDFFSPAFRKKARLSDTMRYPDADAAEIALLAGLRRELRLYLSFLDLASKVLLGMQSEALWLAAEDRIDALARARQGMESGSGVAEARLAALRKIIEPQRPRSSKLARSLRTDDLKEGSGVPMPMKSGV
jgi:hypothetical protein